MLHVLLVPSVPNFHEGDVQEVGSFFGIPFPITGITLPHPRQRVNSNNWKSVSSNVILTAAPPAV